MTKYFYRVEEFVHIVWVSWFNPQNDNVTILPEFFNTRKEAMAAVKELIAEDRSKGFESEFLQ